MSRQSYSSSGTSDWLLGSLKQNPEGLLLLAAGAALLLRTGNFGGTARAASTRVAQRAGDMRDAAAAAAGGNRFSQAASDATEYASEVAGRTMETAGSWASSASAMANDAGRTVGQHSGRFAKQAQSTMNRVLQDQPILVAIAGMAAGAALAATFPATEFEKQNLGPIADEVSEAAGRIGEQLKDATAKAGESLKNAVQERGLNPDGLKEVVGEAASAFSGTMSGGANQKSEPRPGSMAGGATPGADQSGGTSTRSGSNPSSRSG
jgi:hypothetical protein